MTAMPKVLYDDHGWRVMMEEAKLPDGRTKKVARIHRCDSVHLLAFTEKNSILLLREFRPFYGDWIWMLPSGRVDKESDLMAAAQRELQEETGYRAASITHIWTTRHSESFDCANHIYVARGLSKAPLPQDTDELIEVHEASLVDALEKVLAGPQVHTPSAYALLRWDREHAA